MNRMQHKVNLKLSLTCLKSEFFFSDIGCYIKV